MNVDQLVTDAPRYLQYAGNVIAIASMVAAMTPTPADDGVLLVAKKILNLFAFNIGHAMNKK